MAWTASLKNKRQESNGIYLEVEFTDGTKTITKELLIDGYSLDGVKQQIKSEITKLTNNDMVLSGLTIGSIPDPDPNPTPTQAEIDRADWLVDYQRWNNIKTKLIDTGILTGSETAVIALKTKVQNNFKATYIPYI